MYRASRLQLFSFILHFVTLNVNIKNAKEVIRNDSLTKAAHEEREVGICGEATMAACVGNVRVGGCFEKFAAHFGRMEAVLRNRLPCVEDPWKVRGQYRQIVDTGAAFGSIDRLQGSPGLGSYGRESEGCWWPPLP